LNNWGLAAGSPGGGIHRYISGGDRGSGYWETKGQEVDGRQEERGQKAEFPRWWEAGEKGKNDATFHNILQPEKWKEEEANKILIQGGNRD